MLKIQDFTSRQNDKNKMKKLCRVAGQNLPSLICKAGAM